MKKLLPILFLLFLLGQRVVLAQDARFSQYFNKPLLLNPSLAGNGIEYIRLTAIYRNQWNGFGDPFTTQGFSVDKVVNRIGIGAMITRNGGGEGAIATLNLVGNLAYHMPLGSEKNNTLSAGVQIGIVNKSFDPSKLTFDNQYNPDQGYDPNQGSGEVFTTTSITRPDLNAGLFWQRGWLKKDIRFKPFAGMSFAHLNRPVETFIIDDVRVDIKNTFYAGAGYMLNDRTEIKPSMMHNSQGTFKETTFGTNFNYQLDSKNQIQLGVYHRANDAVIAFAGYQMNQLFVGTSYDFNTGEVSKTGKGTNAFEISLAYSPRPKKKKAPEEVKVVAPKKTIINKTIPKLKPALIPNETKQEVATKPINQTVQFVMIPDKVAATATTITKTETKTTVKTAEKSVEKTKVPAETITSVSSVKATSVPATTSEVKPAIKKSVNTTIVIPNEDVQSLTTTQAATKTEILNTIPVAKAETPTTLISNKPVDDHFAPSIPSEAIEPASPIVAVPVTTIPETTIATKPEAKVVVDSDNDGISDAEDRCPFIKGSKLTKGCPDSDNDGMIDMDDDCPLESGPVTNKGCPDPNIPAPKNNQELIKTFDHILFTKGSVKMTTDDIYDIVERAVDMLYADKTLTVLLSGHTDSEGDGTFNMNLSQNRAEVVKAYLLKQGIPESRIQTVAYGETMPISDNLFDENMKQNRRVELNILRRK